MTEPRGQRVRFDDFEIDLRSGELRRGDDVLLLQEKPFQVLAALLERPGEIVLRDELRARLWDGDTHVDFDNNLNAAVKKVRDALGDSADTPRFVETVPRRGYRFIGNVVPEPAAAPATSDNVVAPGLPESPPAPEASRPAPLRPRWQGIAVGASLILVPLIVLWALLSGSGSGTVATSGKTRLVVLPLANLTGDAADDYLVDGVTEDLITHLGRLAPRRLGVIARLSSMTYQGTAKSVAEIGEELDVDYAIQGGVRRSGDQLRITAQLIQVDDETNLWAENYDFTMNDLLKIQSTVAAEIGRAVAQELLNEDREAQARAGTTRTAAYDSYLRGRFHWNRFNGDAYLEAVQHFDRAIELDPRYASAHAGSADAYNLLAFSGKMAHDEAFAQARVAAEQALILDRDLAEAHNSLAFAQLYADWDFASAEQSFEQAISLAPAYAMSHHWYAGVLAATEQHDRAIAAMSHALELDPVALSVISDFGWYYIYADRFDEGIDICERTLEMSPDHGWARSCLIQALYSSGRYQESLEAMIEGSRDELPEGEAERLRAGDPLETLQRIFQDELDRSLADGTPDAERAPLWMAKLHARVGNGDEAMRWLERAYADRDPWLIFIRVDPGFDPVHDAEGFDDLGRRIGLPVDPRPPALASSH